MINPLIYLLVVLFGSSSWLSTDSVWMQLPLMTHTLPEGWNLPSFLVAIVQLGCIAPLLYTIVHKCTKLPIPKAPIILVLMIVCTLTNFLLAFFWNKTGWLFGNEHSMALIGIMFFMAMANATTDVLFLPYVSSFYRIYLTAYFVGMGGLIPSLVALIQGSNNYECKWNTTTSAYDAHYTSPRFGVRTYNLIMFGWLCITIVAFIFLHWFRHLLDKSITFDIFNEDTHSNVNVTVKTEGMEEEVQIRFRRETNSTPATNDETQIIDENVDKQKLRIRYWIFLIILLIINAQMNGVIPSISSFSTLPYSQQTYHLALTLSYGTQPIGSLVSLWLRPKSISIFIVLTVITSFFTGLIVLLAAQSPTPLLHHSFWGAFISVTASVLASFGQCYLRSAITAAVHDDAPNNDETKIFWCGVFMQIGSFVGSWIMFLLTNTYHLFKSGTAIFILFTLIFIGILLILIGCLVSANKKTFKEKI